MSINSIQDLIIKAENYFKTIDIYNDLEDEDVLEPMFVTLDNAGREFQFRNKQTAELFNLGNASISNSVSMKEVLDDENALYHNIKFITPCVVFYYWMKSSKMIYEFDKVMLEQLMDTEDVELHKEIFEYLPVNTFIISTPNYGTYDAILVHIDNFSEDNMPSIIYTVGLSKNNKYEQSLINKNKDDILSLGLSNKYIEFLQKNIIQREPCWFKFNDGTKLSEFKNKVNDYNMNLLKEFKDNEETAQCIEINNTLYDTIKIGILCSYYLCAKNAIIQPRKIKKTMRKMRSNGNKLNFNFNVCGVVQGSKFITQNKQYINYNETSQILTGNASKKKMPHIRRAHWHHYWIGNKNSDERHLELRWVKPMIINADEFGKAPSINRNIDD